ncbi:MAG: sel1 repeat family protein, partial [Waddliaceae bacterium]|nr:sel1 repeat family protein [Waddliaceae bacterium]
MQALSLFDDHRILSDKDNLFLTFDPNAHIIFLEGEEIIIQSRISRLVGALFKNQSQHLEGYNAIKPVALKIINDINSYIKVDERHQPDNLKIIKEFELLKLIATDMSEELLEVAGKARALGYIYINEFQRSLTLCEGASVDQSFYSHQALLLKRSRELFKKSYEKGDNYAGLILAYAYGKKCIKEDPDYKESARLYEVAAAEDFPEAMNNLGRLYKRGHIGRIEIKGQESVPNYAKAAEWYEKAAAKGLPKAMNNLGILYEQGHIGRIKIKEQKSVSNYAKAANWYRKAGEAGYSIAMYNLGLLYNKGRIGRIEIKGQESVPDYAEAARLYEVAAAEDFPEAMNNLGCLYKKGHIGLIEREGQDPVPDYAEAARLFRAAAAKGIPEAMNNLGCLYKKGHIGLIEIEGQDPVPNYAEAAKLFRAAAAKGIPEAMNSLGILYEQGHIGRIKIKEQKSVSNYA